MTSDSDIDTQAGLREPIREPQDRDPRDASAHHTPWVHAYRAIKSVQSARAGARVAAAHDRQCKALQLTHKQDASLPQMPTMLESPLRTAH